MNELDDDVMQLFTADEPLRESEPFAAAVRRRVLRRRGLAKAASVAMVAAIAVAVGALVLFAPQVAVYPVDWVLRLLGPQVAAAVSLFGAVGLVWWIRFGDV